MPGKLVTFIGPDGDTVTNECCDVMPRPGDLIMVSFEPQNESEWADASLEDYRSIHLQEWRVVRVRHEFRVYAPTRRYQIIFVDLEPSDAGDD